MTHQIRITKSGKIKHWVSFALEYFEKDQNNAIELHTLPGPPSKGMELGVTPTSSATIPASLTLVPRLISVVEIIKREYLKTLELQHSTRMHGLHQYNHFGCIEQNEERSVSLALALEGKHYPKQKQVSYMKITLSLEELLDLVKAGATYQPPMTRKLSKSAKSRAKKRMRKEGHTVADADTKP